MVAESEDMVTLSGPLSSAWRLAVAVGTTRFVLIILTLAALPWAWRNYRSGRGDREGALRLAAFVFVLRLITWLLQSTHVPEFGTEVTRLCIGVMRSLGEAALLWLFYIALEPYLRRFWPRTMVSWTRLLDGRLRDPLVGRDVLIGCLLSGILWSIFAVGTRLAELFGLPTPLLSIDIFGLKALLGLREAFSAMLFQHASFMLNAVLIVLMMLLLMRLVLRRTWLALMVWIPFFILLIDPSNFGNAWFGLVTAGLIVTWWLLTFFRVGLLSLNVCFGLIGLGTPVQLGLDPSGVHAGPTWLYLVILAAIATYGFYVSLAGRPMLKAMLEPEN